MNALEKIKLLKEHGELINQILAGGLKPLAKIQSLKRINEIIELLGGNVKSDFTQLVIDEHATNKERRKIVETWLRENLQGKTITTVDGKKVYFNRNKSIDHLTNDGYVGVLEAKATTKIVEVLVSGTFIEVEELKKVRKDNFVAFHKYRKWVQIDDKQVHLQIKVGQFEDGRLELQIGTNLLAYSQKIIGKDSLLNSHQLLDGILANATGLYPNQFNTKSIPQNTELSAGMLNADENHSIMLDSLQDDDATLTILQVLDKNGNDITDDVLGDGLENKTKTPNNEKPFDRTHIDIPRTKTTRQKANNGAFAILDRLDNGEITPTDLTDNDKQILAKYSGNGGALKGRDGKTGSDYEYYTPKELATGMWDLAKELGFNGGRVLDPCCGTGVFTATSPDNVLMDNIELDEISGKISQLLNDGNRSTTTISPFEKIVNSYDDGDDDNGFDMVITNVPFGDNSARGANKLHDTAYQDASLDYYFIMRTLEKLKSGGLAVLMTAPSTITGKGAKQIELRQKTSRIAEFLGAYRLPNSMFTDTGADVSVDVMVFKKYNRHMIDSIAKHYDKGY